MKGFLIKLSLLASLILTTAVYGLNLPDLTKDVQTFVLDEKQISIPGYPDAFNPSIARWYDGRLLLTFRARDRLTNSPNLMGFAWLDENFDVVGKPTILRIYGELPLKLSRAQDPRLVRVGDEYYIVYNNILSDVDIETRRMLVARLHYKEGHFYIINPQFLFSFEGDKKNWREKNWSPFDYNGSLLLSYSLNPHRVFLPIMNTDRCETVAASIANIDWKWGELRGGSPALLDGDHYLGFFHSFVDMATVQSKGKKISHYFMGAYTFENKLPFSMTYVSPSPILGSNFYTAPDYPNWKPLRVVFPGGFVFDENHIWVVYGRQDFETWVVKLDKQGLMDSLVPVHSKKFHVKVPK